MRVENCVQFDFGSPTDSGCVCRVSACGCGSPTKRLPLHNSSAHCGPLRVAASMASASSSPRDATAPRPTALPSQPQTQHQQQKPQPRRSVDLRYSVSGGLGSIFCTYVGQPFDTIKLRMQTAHAAVLQSQTTGGATASAATLPRHLQSPFACLRHMVRNEGGLSPWKGATAALASIMTENVVVFGFNSVFRQILFRAGYGGGEASDDGSPPPLSLPMHAVAGGLAGIFSGTAICPAEVVKCKLQYQRSGSATEGKQSSARYSSALDCAVKTVRQDGWRALFKGLGPILLRDVPFNFIFFGTYESMHAGMAWLDSWRHPADQDSASLEQATGTVVKDSPVRIFLAGGTAGATGWAIMFPLDVIKSSLQSGSMDGIGSSPPTLRSVATRLYTQGGLRIFYGGWSAAVLRAFPANAAMFLGYELGLKMFRRLDED